ncbi:nucleotidyl transferase AbiEii/AbiGii toxin family protein [Streptomyces zhihengii]|uniref:nucleotidyl transferase AbiEii/AbiGii toxin family protein n=1 Tax=Streptomyces zhihengii TaxID=1818004 RepID=UPI00362C3441
MTDAWQPSIPGGPDDPAEPASERHRRNDGPPRTLWAGIDSADRRGRVFDPALKHFAEAYRPLDAAPSEEWRAARRAALDAVLAAVADSPWADSLVLRGSMTMSAWFDGAREPKDIDFVVTPEDRAIDDPGTGGMLDGIAALAERVAAQRFPGPAIDAAGAVREYIWTYERVPGYRMVLPWRAAGAGGGQVQLDFVFNEKLPLAPVTAEVRGVRLRCADPVLALVWKMQWLLTDMYPQGKDLYDAVLLAERHPLPLPLLTEVLRLSGEWPTGVPGVVRLEDVEEAVRQVEWHHFAADAPVPADAGEAYARRLLTAVRPAFAPAR